MIVVLYTHLTMLISTTAESNTDKLTMVHSIHTWMALLISQTVRCKLYLPGTALIQQTGFIRWLKDSSVDNSMIEPLNTIESIEPYSIMKSN